nr:GH25 family lysozyme [uncultured Merdimonas sp.]
MKKRVQRILTLFLASALLFVSVPTDALYASEETAAVEDTEEQAEEDANSDVGQTVETEGSGTKDNTTTNSEDNVSADSGQQEDSTEQSLEEEQTDNALTPSEAEKNDTANSWRFKNGERILSNGGASAYSARSVGAWSEYNGRFYNDRGEVIDGAAAKGIDVSQWNGNIDWAKVKNTDVDYAMIRCGYGMNETGQDDTMWKKNADACTANGIPFGTYLYSYADTVARAKSEAEHVLRLVKGYNLSYPIFYDLEETSVRSSVSKTQIAQIAKTFCDTIRAAGYKVGVYANLDWFNNYLTDSIFNNYDRWVAQWNHSCTYAGDYVMWQCTDEGSVNGISGPVDLDFSMVKTYDQQPIAVEDTNIISYTTHQQTYGWDTPKQNGYQSGYTGYSKRLEAIKINVGEGYGDLGVEYQVHAQSYGWMDPVSNGEMAGTEGESKRLEAVRIWLTGSEADKYDIYYRVHSQTYGWLDWASNGQPAGTLGYSKRAEALQIVVLPKGAGAPGETANPYVKADMTVQYSTYVNGKGWQAVSADGAQNGTTGQALAVEAFRAQVANLDYDCDGDIQYEAYMQSYGWQDAVKANYTEAGIAGGGKRLEAIRMKLTGTLGEKYDIYYRVYVQTYGWLDWAKDWQSAGTFDYAKRVEAVQMKLVEKGGAAPGETVQPSKQALLKYSTHVQTYGWRSDSFDGATSGTTGLAKRLEALRISFANGKNLDEIRYRTHVQTYGWQDWVNGYEISGTEGLAKRMEAVQIELTGEMAAQYDIYYRVHVQTYGWLDWAKNGEPAGTEGLAKRAEAIQIQLVEKGGEAPGSTDRPFVETEQ